MAEPIEVIVIRYLGEQLDVPVYAEVPPTVPGSYVVIQRTGGGVTNYIETASVAVQSCVQCAADGTGKLASIKLNEQVKAAMQGMAALPVVSSCRLERSYDFTDPDTKTYRYQSVFTIVYH